MADVAVVESEGAAGVLMLELDLGEAIAVRIVHAYLVDAGRVELEGVDGPLQASRHAAEVVAVGDGFASAEIAVVDRLARQQAGARGREGAMTRV